VTACCSAMRFVETIWETDGLKRKRVLGEVVVCAKHLRPIGDVKRADTGRRISPEEWSRMVKWRAMPPWYFVSGKDGDLMPEGWNPEAAS
jgi:hypothetical protein